ncbi:MAG: VWA domain-containing protein [Clostridia bacterium]|nr:VWA domain-containing protein [Clostridia bacterium]
MLKKLTAAIQRHKKWLVMVACLVVFVVTYALILPAITIDTDTAVEEPGLEVVLQESDIPDESEDAPGGEEAEPAAELPPVKLTERSGDVSVKVEAEAGVFPENIRLVLNPVDEAPWKDSIADAVDEDAAVKNVSAVEIAFEDSKGEPVQPQDSFTLTVASFADDDVLMTLDPNGGAEVLESRRSEMTVAPDEVPVVALVRTGELQTTFLSASGVEYEATVTFTEKANVPEDATLRLTEITESSDDYEAAKQLLLDAGLIPSAADDFEDEDDEDAEPDTGSLIIPLEGDGDVFWKSDAENKLAQNAGLDVLDLCILDADGNEIEPDAPVQVKIVMRSLPEDISADDFFTSVKVTHLCETEDGVTPEVVAGNLAGEPGEIAVENGEAVATFETDSFSQYTLSWENQNGNSRSVIVHYGRLNNNGNFSELAASNFNNGTPNITRSGSPNYLIYDMENYEFDYAYRVSASSGSVTRIQPFLRYYRNNSGSNISYRYYVEDADADNSGEGLSNGDQIYMVYKAKTAPTAGGVAVPVETGEKPTPPDIEKKSENNHDGTRTLSLSITGHETPLEATKVADVIVIFDVSGSMKNDMAGNSTDNAEDSRVEIAKDSIKWLANELLPQTAPTGDHLFRMALVTFSNRAQVVQELTYDLNSYNASVDSFSADGGTNWEEALKVANRMSVDSDRDTVVIFVTDGDPTWRMTRYNVSDSQLRDDSDVWTANQGYYYRFYDVFGHGNSDDQDRNYQAALAEAQSIVGQNKTLYTIAISNQVQKMTRLARESGAGEGNSYTVESEADLAEVIEDIKLKLTGAEGWGGISMIDGITSLTNLVAKTTATNVQEDSFTYTKTKDGVTTPWDPTSEGANEATYNTANGAVEWNMGNNFQLEDNVTYTVSFRVWPSQEASDLVTDLNNQVITYDSLTQAQKDQIWETGGYYSLKTNTDDASVTYYASRTVAGVTTVSDTPEPPLYFDQVEPLVVNTMPFTIRKIYTDELTGGEDRQDKVILVVERRPVLNPDAAWEPVHVSYRKVLPDGELLIDQTEIELSDLNNWSATFYISPGLTDAEGDACNPGYVYRLAEPGIDYHYEINSENVTPMFFGFSSLAEAQASSEGELIEDMADEKKVYIREQYVGDEDHDKALTAENLVKGGIDLRKYVVDAEGKNDLAPEEEFTIHGYILDPDGNGYTFNLDWDDRTDVSGRNDAGPDWIEHQNDPIAFHIYNKNGDRVGYKMHVADTSNFTVTLKSGERIRFVNVPQNCTYAFWEEDADMPDDYAFVSIEGYNLTRDESGDYTTYLPDPYPDISADGRVLSGVAHGNVQHNVVLKNRSIEPDRIIVKKTVFGPDGVTPVYPNHPFTISGYVLDRYGDPYTAEGGNALSYNIVDKDGNYVVEGAQFPTSNTFTVTLNGGDKLEILDVPDLSSYLIWEETDEFSDPNSNFEFISISGAAISESGTPTQPHNQTTFGEECVGGTLHEGEEHDIFVYNRMLHDYVELQIEKVDAADPDKKLNGATFMLYDDEYLSIPSTDFNGNPIGEIVTGGYADAEETQPLGIGYVGNLIPGTYYLLETGSPPGYDVLEDVVVVTVSSGGVTVLQPGNAASSASVYALDGVVTIMIADSSGVELPHTGGTGTLLYTSGGLLLMAAAMIYLVCARRKERRIE